MIKIDHLVKNYGATRAVDDISFEVAKGEIVGLLGPNGAGKSTTMNILAGYLSSSAGRVIVDGLNVLDEPLDTNFDTGATEQRLPADTASSVMAPFRADMQYGLTTKEIIGKSEQDAYDIANPAVGSSQPSGGFLPNVFYALGELAGDTTFALATPADNTIVNHYYWTFDTPSTAPTITWPTGLTWVGGSAPTLAASKHYEVSIINGVAAYMEV
jgi:energy-coupling factor transporter ATP-binding protein EcfA2